MVLPICIYGEPILRRKGARIEDPVAPEVQGLIDDMFETMAASHGIGLAAQQVGRALQLAVVDVRDVKDRPSTLTVEGRPVSVDSSMPLVLVNPEWKPTAAAVAGPEGCLSFPDIYADIERPDQIEVRALDRRGRPIRFECGGLLARAIQHEWDHLQGILFVDRMTSDRKAELRDEIRLLQATTRAALKI